MSDGVVAEALWNTLDKSNQSLAKVLLSLSDLHARDSSSYTDAVKQISPVEHPQVGVDP